MVCFILLALLFVLVSACGPTGTTLEEDAPRDGAGGLGDRWPMVTVSRVMDGDTVEIVPAVDSLTEVRLIGVDTPETEDPRTGVQPYGEAAYRFSRHIVQHPLRQGRPPADEFLLASRHYKPSARAVGVAQLHYL